MKITDAGPDGCKIIEPDVYGDDRGWFYTVEFLIRAERAGVKILDMPVEWVEDYNTTVNVMKTIKNYIIRMTALKKLLKEESRNAEKN